MSDYIKREDAIEQARRNWTGEGDWIASTEINLLKNLPTANVRDDATAHKVVGGGERYGATCWFECDNCGLAVDIGDVFCKHCGARFVP